MRATPCGEVTTTETGAILRAPASEERRRRRDQHVVDRARLDAQRLQSWAHLERQVAVRADARVRRVRSPVPLRDVVVRKDDVVGVPFSAELGNRGKDALLVLPCAPELVERDEVPTLEDAAQVRKVSGKRMPDRDQVRREPFAL